MAYDKNGQLIKTSSKDIEMDALQGMTLDDAYKQKKLGVDVKKTLSGGETDSPPSVAAVNSGLANKASKTELATGLAGKQAVGDYATKSDLNAKANKTDVNSSLATKQDKLVSGTNLKTINNQSLLGSGNITIQGGGGSDVVAGTNVTIETTSDGKKKINANIPTGTTQVASQVAYTNSDGTSTNVQTKLTELDGKAKIVHLYAFHAQLSGVPPIGSVYVSKNDGQLRQQTGTTTSKYIVLTPSLDEIYEYDGIYYVYRNGHFVKLVNDVKVRQSQIVINQDNDFNSHPISPVLWGVKYLNDRNKANGYLGANIHPIPIGWLYYDADNPISIYYSSIKADNPKKLFDWNAEKVRALYDNVYPLSECQPLNYSVVICNNGDIVCVFRNELVNNSSRRYPIMFKHDDYSNPIIIQVSDDGVSPTGWIANSGIEYVTEKNYFIFTEYTRPWTEPASAWKVSYPFDNASNWKRVIKTGFHDNGSGTQIRDVEHIHSVNVDMFTGLLYISSGDALTESKLWKSSDDGETWTIVKENDQAACRALNFVFTQDAMYWGSDNNDMLIKVSRDDDGIPDIDTIEKIQYPYGDPPFGVGRTYFTILIDKPYGLVMLQRQDSTDKTGRNGVATYFYDLIKKDISIIDINKAIDYQNGFRCDSVNFYQSPYEHRIVCGFNSKECHLDIVGNKAKGLGQPHNIVLDVY